MQRKLGSKQADVLRALRDHKRWRPNCGWYWDTTPGTQRIMDRLVALGYARLDKGWYYPVGEEPVVEDTCELCERVVGEDKGQCAYAGCRGCKIVQGRLQLKAIRG